jgi:hypothetical protein
LEELSKGEIFVRFETLFCAKPVFLIKPVFNFLICLFICVVVVVEKFNFDNFFTPFIDDYDNFN